MKNLTNQILQRDKTGKPILKLTPLIQTVVYTPTKKSFNELMRVYEIGGWIWISGNLPTQSNVWRIYKKETCVDAGINFHELINRKFGYANREFYQEKNSNIISTQEFYKIENISLEIRKEINNYFEENKE